MSKTKAKKDVAKLLRRKPRTKTMRFALEPFDADTPHVSKPDAPEIVFHLQAIGGQAMAAIEAEHPGEDGVGLDPVTFPPALIAANTTRIEVTGDDPQIIDGDDVTAELVDEIVGGAGWPAQDVTALFEAAAEINIKGAFVLASQLAGG